jgi:GWxTD domain-containing protein
LNKEKIYKILIVFLLAIFLSNLLVAQKRKKFNQNPTNNPFYLETHVIPLDSSFMCYLSYRITYNNLLFVKENSHYSSGYSVTFEIYEDTKFIKRVIGNGKVSAKTYANTINENLYHDGLISFEIKEGNYLIKPSIILNNTAIEARIKPIKFVVDSNQINMPIFVKSEKPSCNNAKYQLVNFQNSLPFSNSKFDMLIPIYQEINNKIRVEILQNEKQIFDKEITEYKLLNPNITVCNGKIVLNNNSNSPLIKFYKVSFVNQKLIEGEFEVKLKIGDENINFTAPVVWYDKPRSLLDTKKAIEYLEIIGFKQQADSLLDFSEEDEYKVLFDYWRKLDDDSTTSFNTIFDEFYRRIDYVKNQFNSLGENDGVDTDRGKIYVFYGKPDNIERTFNDINNVIEIWEYKSINKKIYFSDKTGTGKFKRIK